MKEFRVSNTVTYNLMSFTGFKALLLFSALYVQPLTFEDISKLFANQEYLNEPISRDTLRVYINSLEMMGCKIIKQKKSEGGKYFLADQPFKLKICDEHAKSILKLYKSIINDIEIEDLLALTKFFERIGECVQNQELREKLFYISPIKKINIEILKSLIVACRKKQEITIKYNSPSSGLKNIDVLAEKLKLNRGRIYLLGTSLQYNNSTTFLVNRITEVPTVKINKSVKIIEPVKVVCEIYNKNIVLNENEKVIEEDENKRVVEISSKNLFYTKQRVLALNTDCKVIAPLDFKKDVISTLKKMRDNYGR